MKDVLTRKPTRILALEDNEYDRTLLEWTFKTEGLKCDFIHASTKHEFETALDQGAYDLIISDFTIPSYDGLSALAATRKRHADTPFIFVSGTIGEERAIESLKCGATDYVLKDGRDRLISSVHRALRESREHAERKRLEGELRQAQKMEAVGRLAAGVAHDFNNLLAVIQGNAELALLNKDKLDVPTCENLSQISLASQRAANLTRQLLTFGRKHTIRCEPIDLNEAINNLARMLKRIIGEDINLQCHCGPERLFVNGDAGMLDQVTLNLAINSRDAMLQGGQLTISTEKIVIDDEYVQSHPEAATGAHVCLMVTDTGCGIAPENMAQIFEPFFTTKEVGKGTGMGLATVHGIVKQHHGWIDLSSALGVGTTFKVFLPMIAEPVNSSAPSEAVQPVSFAGKEGILLVEDDPAVRLVAGKILKKYGYQVFEAASGRKALQLWQTHGPQIDLLLTDVVMPHGINGCDLAAFLRKQRSDLNVVFVSGYNSNIITNDSGLLKRENYHFLAKPFQSQALAETVRRCLDEGKSSAATRQYNKNPLVAVVRN